LHDFLAPLQIKFQRFILMVYSLPGGQAIPSGHSVGAEVMMAASAESLRTDFPFMLYVSWIGPGRSWMADEIPSRPWLFLTGIVSVVTAMTAKRGERMRETI
jgi:hypothetical protein